MSHILFERVSADYTVKLARYPAGLGMAEHAHDQDGVSVVLDGALVEEARHGSVTATAGWTVVKPAGTVHANRFGPAGASLLAIVPRSDRESAFPSGWRWLDQPVVFRAALRLLRSQRDDCMIELLASLASERARAADSVWLRTVKRALDDLAVTPPSVSELAADADVHPVYLARRFRGAFGVSIREYRLIAQVRRAIQLVVGTRRSLSEIAHSCGFADHSHMCRSFRIVAQTSPGALRAS